MTRCKPIAALLFVALLAEPALADPMRCEAFGQLRAAAPRESALNPDGMLPLPELSAEAGPVCGGRLLGWDWQLRGAASYARTTESIETRAARLVLRQLYRRFDFDDAWSLTAGRKVRGWDVSYVAQPIDFLGEQKDARALEDRLHEITPSAFASLDRITGDAAYSFIFGENLLYEQTRSQVILLAETELRGTSLQLVLQKPSNQPLGAGGSFSTVIGEALEIHGSFFTRRGTARPIHLSLLTGELRFYQPDEDPVSDYRLDDRAWYPRWVIGGHWTFRSGLNLLLEGMHDRRGLSPAQWRRLLALAGFHASGTELGVPATAVAGNLGLDASALSRGGSMREYFFIRLAYPLPKLDIEVNTLLNAHDHSASPGVRLTYRASPYLQVWVDARWNVGGSQSEFGAVPVASEQTIALRYFFPGAAR